MNANVPPIAKGISRISENNAALLVFFDRKPTDDEMRAIHERLANAAPQGGGEEARDDGEREALVRELLDHAYYMHTYDKPFVGSTEAVASALNRAATALSAPPPPKADATGLIEKRGKQGYVEVMTLPPALRQLVQDKIKDDYCSLGTLLSRIAAALTERDGLLTALADKVR